LVECTELQPSAAAVVSSTPWMSTVKA
jgi:hypothetical protein